MNLPAARVFEVAASCRHFRVLPDGQKPPVMTVRVCSGLSCTLAGSAGLLERARAALPTDIEVTATPCVGRCEQAPVAVVHQRPLPSASVAAIVDTVQVDSTQHPRPPAGGSFEPALLAERPVAAASADVVPAFVDHATYCARGGYALAAAVIAGTRSADAVLDGLDRAGLRGLGGSGVPAGRKWRQVKAQPGPRLLVVNIDEGEPGTFKDRTYLERDPHRFLEASSSPPRWSASSTA